MSVKYALIKAVIRASGMKKQFLGEPEEIVERAKKRNEANFIPELKDKDGEVEISKIEVDGFPVLTMTHKEAKKANLFIIGGGMIAPPRPKSIEKSLLIAKESGLDLWIPYYPLCTEYPITRAFEVILAVYKKMLERYGAERISVLGSSSGGNLALGLPAYINFLKSDTPMPSAIIALSPGSSPTTDEEWKRMEELDKKDIMIPAAYMKHAEKIMRHGSDSVPDFMLHLQNGDFTACPKVFFMYGSDETLFALAPSFEAAMKKYDVPYEMIVGEGMFHCYPVFPICPEAKAGWKQMIAIMKKC